MENAILEFVTQWGPLIISVLMVPVIACVIRSALIKHMKRMLTEDLVGKVMKCLKENETTQENIAEIRDDVASMLGKPPKKGRRS